MGLSQNRLLVAYALQEGAIHALDRKVDEVIGVEQMAFADAAYVCRQALIVRVVINPVHWRACLSRYA